MGSAPGEAAIRANLSWYDIFVGSHAPESLRQVIMLPASEPLRRQHPIPATGGEATEKKFDTKSSNPLKQYRCNRPALYCSVVGRRGGSVATHLRFDRGHPFLNDGHLLT